MGKGEQQPGFLRSNLTTIILLVVLVILAIVSLLAYKGNWAAKFRRGDKDKDEGSLEQSRLLHDVGDQPRLEVTDSGIRLIGKFS